jgi:hypothetical protein
MASIAAIVLAGVLAARVHLDQPQLTAVPTGSLPREFRAAEYSF